MKRKGTFDVEIRRIGINLKVSTLFLWETLIENHYDTTYKYVIIVKSLAGKNDQNWQLYKIKEAGHQEEIYGFFVFNHFLG